MRADHTTDNTPARRRASTGGDPERLWRAVLERDASLDGAFVYAVESTRIYCRPSCPSRRPARTRVRFLPSPLQAEARGFRPCRRCRPDAAETGDPARTRVLGAVRAIEAAETPPTLAELGRAVGLSPHHLQRSFKRLLGVTPRQYADARRQERLRAGLRSGQAIAGALYAAGYGSGSRLYENARTTLGMTPATYRRGGRGERIRHGVAVSPFGLVLVAATDQGICRIALGDSREQLRADLERELPAAELVPADRELEGWIERLLADVAAGLPASDLPLDVRATAFQRRVWETLRRIPAGATATYGEVARAIGAPGAERAVARACARNPLALLIPCHRVVRGDGDTGGYRWGVARKRALLEREGAYAPSEK